LALDREAHLALLKTVEDVTFRDRAQPLIVDLADGRSFLDEDNECDALGSLLALEPDILEISGIPQGVEIPL
jgi:hypothetical protein